MKLNSVILIMQQPLISFAKLFIMENNKVPYTEGREAFENKTASLEECPYPQGLGRMDWIKGWDEAQNEAAEDWADEQIRKNR